MPGPLVEVSTITGSITLDVSRLLYMGENRTLQFIVPDRNSADQWAVLLTLTEGFNRIVGSEDVVGDGRDVIFKVADLQGTLVPILRTASLHIRLDSGEIYVVSKVPKLAENEAQIFTLQCKEHTLRTNFNSRR